MTERIPVGIAICCREWIVAFGFPIGRCGICNERPVYDRLLPEEQWPIKRPPRRPEGW